MIKTLAKNIKGFVKESVLDSVLYDTRSNC